MKCAAMHFIIMSLQILAVWMVERARARAGVSEQDTGNTIPTQARAQGRSCVDKLFGITFKFFGKTLISFLRRL